MGTEDRTAGPARQTNRSGPVVAFTRWMENLGETGFAYLLLTPVFLLLGTIALYPLLRTFELSLYQNVLSDPEFVGLENYVQLFTGAADARMPGTTTFLPEIAVSSSFPFVHVSGLLRSALAVTIIFTVVSVLFETIIGFGQALVLDREFRGRRWVRAAIIIPWAIPIVIQGMIFYLMFHPDTGFLTEYLASWGLVAPTNTLNDPASSLLIVTVADIWKTTAFMALLILAGLQSIDRSLYDVAEVAGASKWQQFKLITFPLVLPALGIAVLFRTIDAMRIYGLVDSVSGCTTVPSLSCMVVETFNTNRGLASAIAFVTAGIIAIAVLGVIYQQYKEGF
ncbi:carbohydrate ABC transporter membrane protein 1, CUT1 family [Halobiforma haloterrestris]|uniref:Carbohydrate ABC transporter membrane protein 1, CUT1 family n=1 Tax=Natronobacterium haloterrestre TaxID=148448 RepID=A0A1I1J826_NATHA|nr:sugar ABC transporter permease [Halobiforma haloterrestris]SFC44535.1 carbohydrate ABC transporter membrane protein 1, CUT1 family [Halobiforma haloterrestris]